MNLSSGTMQTTVEILIVEDSPTQAGKLRLLLEGAGYKARIAGNGRSALEAIEHRKPDLVLSDIIMPELDGYGLCRAIKSNSQYSDVPVILVTALIDSSDILRGLECGADNFVRKPYADDYLLSRIRHVLINSGLRKERDQQADDRGLEVYLDGEKHVILAERQQILDLLISTYEQAVVVNEELRTREREVNELNVRLGQHAAQLEATNQEIARQNLELDRANRMKSEFLANMSHELRTPLNAVIGFAEALKGGLLGELAPQQEEAIRDIFDSGKHLLSLINDILDLSKIEAGKMELELEPTHIQRLLQSSFSMLREKASTARVRMRLEMENIGWVYADQRKTRQVAYNLLSNAIKFTPAGGNVTLRMCIRDCAELQGMKTIGTPANLEHFLTVSVIDTGIGISEGDLDRLFQPFVQLDSGLSRKYEGTGLGLALIKQLVDLHGGAITVRSKPEEGSEFTVWLPYRKAEAPAEYSV